MTDVVTPISAHMLTDAGENRGIGFNGLGASSDADAVRLFLRQYTSADTLRAYRREVYRLVTWAMYMPRKPLTSLNADDFAQYAKFLTHLPPSWCNKELLVPTGESLVLFRKSLTRTSLHHAFAIVKSFMTFLQRHNYIHTYPLFKNTLSSYTSQEVQKRRVMERQLCPEQRKALFRWLDENPGFDSDRVRFCASLILYIGLRIHEVATHRMGDFMQIEGGVWIFKVVGKGQKYEELFVPTRLLEELIRFRRQMGLSPLPAADDAQPLIMGASGQAICERWISQIIKNAIVQAAELLPEGRSKNEMKKCSSHWFRHMFVSQMVRSGMHMEDVQKMARHSKRETTGLYIDSIWDRRQAAIQSLDYEANESLAT